MSLRSKIVLILVSVVVAYATIDHGLQRLFAGQAFGRLEREVAATELARIRQRIDDELDDLVGKGRVYAGMGAMSRFLGSGTGDFVTRDMGTHVMEQAEVDLIYVVDGQGRVLKGSIREPDTHAPMRLPEFPGEALSPGHPAIVFRQDDPYVAGVMMTRGYPLLFCTIPVAEESGNAVGEEGLFVPAPGGFRRPATGAVILGRFLGSDLKQRIVSEELALSEEASEEGTKRIELLESGAPGLPPGLMRAVEERLIVEGDDGLLHAYERVGALRTNEPLVLHVALDRPIEAHRRLTVNFVLLSTLIGGCLFLFVLLRLLQRIVIAPLSTLTSKAVEIGKRDDTTIRMGFERSDEIGQLAGEFDRMMGKLAQSREQVVETARLAGRSEIATGVLHNVGNVLNSVNVAANLATKKADDLSVKDLEALVGVLQSHEEDLATFVGQDPRGKHLVPFLVELSGALARQRQGIQEELGSLNQGIEHIAELVRAQQSHAGAKGVFELASLNDQVEGALSICRQGLSAVGEVEIERDFEELPSLRVDKHKLMEVLVNLIQNAGQALAERGGSGLKLSLRIARLNEGTVRIEVRDNGTGISPENLTRVFHHGFTTKKNGHGFGLHVCANAATEMGAKLTVASDGPGTGAAFFVDIPMEPETALAAA